MPTIKPKYRWPGKDHDPWGTCCLCSPEWTRVELVFQNGSVEPSVDEVLTGDTSGDTGTVVSVELLSGAWADGDAAGVIELKDCTGVADRECFEDEESITGDGGASLEADGVGVEKTYGIFWPFSMLMSYEGKTYCKYHYRFRVRRKEIDKVRIDVEPDPEYIRPPS